MARTNRHDFRHVENAWFSLSLRLNPLSPLPSLPAAYQPSLLPALTKPNVARSRAPSSPRMRWRSSSPQPNRSAKCPGGGHRWSNSPDSTLDRKASLDGEMSGVAVVAAVAETALGEGGALAAAAGARVWPEVSVPAPLSSSLLDVVVAPPPPSAPPLSSPLPAPAAAPAAAACATGGAVWPSPCCCKNVQES